MYIRIYFSPTNSTKEIANLVANEVGSYQEIDLSKKETWSIKYLMQMMFV